MKSLKYLILPVFIFSVYNCFAQKKKITLKSTYTSFPYVIQSNANYDSTWKKIILLMRKFDMGAKLIDKDLGIIVAQMDNAKLSFENKGVIDDTSAWAVVEKIYDVATNKYYSADVGIINWYMRLEIIDQTTQLIIDSISLKSTNTIHGFLYIPGISYKEEYHNLYNSTGRLEFMLKKELE